MTSILYLDNVPASLEPLLRSQVPPEFDLVLWDRLNEDEREDWLGRADYLVVGAKKVGSELITKATRARLLQKIGAGTDNIDLSSAKRQNLVVANAPGGNAGAVADMTMLLILALYRQLRRLDAAMRAGEWPMWELRPSSFEMAGKVHGIVGLGAVGCEVAKRSRAFGTELMYFDTVRSPVADSLEATYRPLERLLSESDIVSLHIPLNASTRHLLSAAELALMKRSAVLVNVARGGLVDEAALYSALRDGRLAGAGLDVWEEEPPSVESPLLRLDRVVATPHVGAGTCETYSRVLAMAVENIERYEKGDSVNNVVEEPHGSERG